MLKLNIYHKYSLISLLIFMIGLVAGNDLKAQSTDTIKIDITNIVYDTITIADTVITYDTIWVERKFDNWNLSVTYSPFLTNWRGDYVENISTENKPNSSLEINIEAEKNKWSFSTGVWLTQFNNNESFNFKIQKVDTLTNTEITPNNYYTTDTTSSFWEYFLNYYYVDDSLVVEMDSVENFVFDSTLISSFDTTYTSTFDTSQVDTSISSKYSFRYLEIPLIFRYEFAQTGNFKFNFGTGILAGILVYSESYFLNTSNNSTDLHPESVMYKILPSLRLSIGVSYNLNERFKVQFEPYYIFGLRSIYQENLTQKKIPDRYGLRFGACWIF